MQILNKIHLVTILLGSVILGALSSCNTNKNLVGNQKYVAPSKFKIKSNEKIRGKNDLQYELSTFEKQKPNAKFLGIARMRLWQYYRIQNKPDTTKFNKWIAKVIAEEPSILNEEFTRESAENMEIFLKRKGYFDAEVNYQIDSAKHTASSVYNVDLKSLYTIDTAIVQSKDRRIIRLIERNKDQSLLQPGAPVSFENYQKESNRIRTLLRNQGYARFQTNFITRFRGDSINVDGPHKVKIEYDIITPTDSTFHQQYRIGRVTVIPEFTPENILNLTVDTLIDGYTFLTSGAEMRIKPQTIIENLFLKSGNLYRQRDQDKTSLQLSNLGVYRFVTVKPVFPTDRPPEVDFEIYLTLNKKLALGASAEINNTNRTATATSLVGTALSINFRNRNSFGGAEAFLLNSELGLEIDPSSSNKLISNVNASIEASLQIPRFNDYFGIMKGLFKNKRSNIDNPTFYNILVDNANTSFNSRFNYVDLNNAYTFNSFELSYGWNVNNVNGKTWNLDHIGIDYLVPTIDPDFATRAPEILRRSLVRQFITGFIIPKEFNRKVVKRVGRKNTTQTTILRLEQSGSELWLFDQLNSTNDPLRIGNSTFSKFTFGSYDFSKVRRLSPGSSVGYRLFGGLVVPFGDSDVVPFVKQFNGGGANSVRGWRLYELGPGSYKDPLVDTPQDGLNIIQTANVKFEANVEWRFDLFWRLKSALFIDVGNIWTLESDPERPGSAFKSSDFFNDLAVSIGTGARMDFTYFIFRVDIGFKFRTPYINYSGNNYTPFSDFLERRNRAISIALGYPF